MDESNKCMGCAKAGILKKFISNPIAIFRHTTMNIARPYLPGMLCDNDFKK